MPYYDTLEEDLKRAKEILEKGKAQASDKPDWMTDHQWAQISGNAGTIFGADVYAAYKLLESFVKEIGELRTPCACCRPTCVSDGCRCEPFRTGGA
jgi:hypothetical protein